MANKLAKKRLARRAAFTYHKDTYSLGGILSSLGSGAGAGMAFGPIGAAIGGGLGLIGGIAGHVGEEREKDSYETALEEARKQQEQDLYAATVGSSENPFTPTFPLGGMLPYIRAEVEDDEVLQKPSGKLKKMSGKRHEQGGINVKEPAGTRVYSDREIFKPSGRTYAEEANEIRKRIAQLDKMLS